METYRGYLLLLLWAGGGGFLLCVLTAGLVQLAAQAASAVRRGLSQLTPHRLWQGMVCLASGMLMALAVTVLLNHGKLPDWLTPPPLSAFAGESGDATAASTGQAR